MQAQLLKYDENQPRVPEKDISGQGGQWTRLVAASAPPESISKFREDNWSAKKETAIIVKNGIAVRTVGQNKKHEIEFNDEDIEIARGGEIIHNHPSASALSEKDFIFAHKADLASMEAFGTDLYTGERVSWTAAKPVSGWPSPQSVKSAYKIYEKAYVIRAREQMRINGWDSYQAAHWATNEILVRVAEKVGIGMVRNVYP